MRFPADRRAGPGPKRGRSGPRHSESEGTMRRTKIVCTIGPACETEEKLRELALAGMNVARLNFSHGSHAWHEERVRLLRKLADELGRPIGILQDLCGPKIRLGE